MIQWIVSSSLLILVMIGLRFLLRGRIKPRLQYALWALVLARLLLPVQFGSAPISVENAVSQAPIVQEMEIADQVTYFDYHLDGFATGYYTYTPVEDGNPSSEIQNEPVPELFTHAEADRLTHLRSTKELLLTVWVGGMILMGAAFLVSNLVFALRLRRSRKLLEKGKLPIYVSDATETPCLFGLFRPGVYLTTSVAEEEHHKEYAVAHEMTHYRQGDALWSVLRSLCLIVHWYNPLVWWAAVLSREDGEIACDEATIAALGEDQRAEYGHVLIDLTCRKTTDLLRTATTMTGSAKGLKERIKMIAKRPKMAIYTLIAVLLVAAITVGCTFTGANKGKDSTDDPTQETTEPTKPTETTDPVEEDHLQDIVGTTLTADELSAFTALFTNKGNGEQDMNYWYNILLACEFSRPVDINPNRLFQNGFRPYPELTEADEAFLSTLWWYVPNGGDILKLFPDRMEEILNTYLGVSLSQINQYYLENMIYFAEGDWYLAGGGGAIGARDFEMVDGKREADGTVWLLARGVREENYKYITDWERVICLKPQEENSAVPYRVESCKWVTYFGKPYPQTEEKDIAAYIVFMYTGEPVSVKGKVLSENLQENCLYAYNIEKDTCGTLVEWPVHSYDVGSGYVYFINQGQTQILRTPLVDMRYGEKQLQVVYASGNKLTGVSCGENNKLFVEEQGGITVWYDMTTGERQYLPSAEAVSVGTKTNNKYFLLRYLPNAEIMDGGYEGKPYSTEGMKMDYLYAIDDGVTYPISDGTVGHLTWAKDAVQDYVYFVRKDDPQKVWRTDIHGQNAAVVYESQNGEITFLATYPGWLAIVENGNRAVLYDLAGGKRLELLKAYKIEQFSYNAEYKNVYWRGQLNKSETDVPIEGNGYYYYLSGNEYKKVQPGTSGIPITPEQ